MFRHDSVKVPVTFRDVAAYFSEEEWKLLHEWQKELYTNVMKEIHQAILSLGPLIATSVFSLRADEQEDLCASEHDASEGRHSSSLPSSEETAVPIALFGLNSEEKLPRTHHLNSKEEEVNHCISTDTCLRKNDKSSKGLVDHHDAAEHNVEKGESYIGHRSGNGINAKIVTFCIKEEDEESYSKDALDGDRREKNTNQIGIPLVNTDFSMRKEEEPSKCLMDHHVTEGESITDHSSGHSVFPVGDAFCIKKEKETYSIDQPDSDIEERTDTLVAGPDKAPEDVMRLKSATNQQFNNQNETQLVEDLNSENRVIGDEDTSSQCEDIDDIEFVGETQADISALGNIRETERQRCSKLDFLRRQLWPQLSQEPQEKETAQCEKYFSSPVHYNVHQSPTGIGTTIICNEYETNTRIARPLTGLQSTQASQRPKTCSEYGKNAGSEDLIEFHRTFVNLSPRERPYRCAHCEKRFSLKSDRNRHQRIHTGEKPYLCVDCQKRFSRKDHFNKHRRIHMGESSEKTTVEKRPRVMTHLESQGWTL